MSLRSLGAGELRRVNEAFAASLARHQRAINALNVFPVPDGDTGTNMLATANSVLAELALIDPDTSDLRAVCSAISRGSLMGARGNSGVILCQVLRGLSDELALYDAPGASELTAALVRASAAARAAVLRPIEGTILTVADGASGAALAVPSGSSLFEVATATRKGAIAALWRTPKLLPVLADAGVVDAGGTGLVLLFDAFCHVVGGSDLLEELPLPPRVAELVRDGDGARVVTDPHTPPRGTDLSYEVMFLLDAEDDAIGRFKERWRELGDSIVVVGGGGIWNCHVHTNDIGGAIEAAVEVGRPREIRVSDLREQVAEQAWVLGATGTAKLDRDAVTSVVAVATGEGIAQIFASLGVGDVVAGGQSMNPSTREILDFVEAASGSDVVILPNNTNVVPVARSVIELSRKNVSVVPTAGVQEGFAALLAYDPRASGEENSAQMAAAAERVVAGEVTKAVRDASSSVGPVEKGDWIGLSRAGIESVGRDLAETACALVDRLVRPEHELVTVITGDECPPRLVEEITVHLTKTHPQISVESLRGGQPLYPLLFSLE